MNTPLDNQQELFTDTGSLADALKAGIEPPKEKWARVLAECVDVIAAAFQRSGVEDERALDFAQLAVLTLAEYQGGRQVYLPRGASLRNALRDRLIYHMAGRGNTDALAERFNLTARRIEQIVAEQHAINVRRMQPSLFTG